MSCSKIRGDSVYPPVRFADVLCLHSCGQGMWCVSILVVKECGVPPFLWSTDVLCLHSCGQRMWCVYSSVILLKQGRLFRIRISTSADANKNFIGVSSPKIAAFCFEIQRAKNRGKSFRSCAHHKRPHCQYSNGNERMSQ